MSITTRKMKARQKKSGEEYLFSFGQTQFDVLSLIATRPGLSDSEITFRLGKHMVAADRCRLRDAGLVTQAGRNARGMTWEVTQAGQVLLGELTAESDHHHEEQAA